MPLVGVASEVLSPSGWFVISSGGCPVGFCWTERQPKAAGGWWRHICGIDQFNT